MKSMLALLLLGSLTAWANPRETKAPASGAGAKPTYVDGRYIGPKETPTPPPGGGGTPSSYGIRTYREGSRLGYKMSHLPTPSDKGSGFAPVMGAEGVVILSFAGLWN